MKLEPARILMLKSHSAGIGDILRGSAAWRVLKNAYPQAALHLLLLSKEPGYPSEELLRDHDLLESFTAVDKRTQTRLESRRYWAQIKSITAKIQPDLVIDFEGSGLRTSLVALWCRWKYGAKTIGVGSVPGRGWFYSKESVAPKKFARQREFKWPMDYTDRDFVALSALGLERAGCPIEMKETASGRSMREKLQREQGWDEFTQVVGLNIGCGTADALPKRPDLRQLSELIAGLQRDHGFKLVLAGAPFERNINEEFCALHRQNYTGEIVDLAGKTSISALTGLIRACNLFISSDSGPYHMSVALKVPTLAVFRWENREHFHAHPWIRCCVVGDLKEPEPLRRAAEELLSWSRQQKKNAHV